MSLRSNIVSIPKFLKLEPPTDKYLILVLLFCSFDITSDANLSPEGSPVRIKIFFVLS